MTSTSICSFWKSKLELFSPTTSFFSLLYQSWRVNPVWKPKRAFCSQYTRHDGGGRVPLQLCWLRAVDEFCLCQWSIDEQQVGGIPPSDLYYPRWMVESIGGKRERGGVNVPVCGILYQHERLHLLGKWQLMMEATSSWKEENWENWSWVVVIQHHCIPSISVLKKHLAFCGYMQASAYTSMLIIPLTLAEVGPEERDTHREIFFSVYLTTQETLRHSGALMAAQPMMRRQEKLLHAECNQAMKPPRCWEVREPKLCWT